MSETSLETTQSRLGWLLSGPAGKPLLRPLGGNHGERVKRGMCVSYGPPDCLKWTQGGMTAPAGETQLSTEASCQWLEKGTKQGSSQVERDGGVQPASPRRPGRIRRATSTTTARTCQPPQLPVNTPARKLLFQEKDTEIKKEKRKDKPHRKGITPRGHRGPEDA